MQPGQILVADQQGVYVIKMIGDVRLTLCISFDRFIEKMLGQPDFSMVLFDLSQASGIDSTTLGLMARIGIQVNDRYQVRPVVFSDNPSINRVLESMGFQDIFCIVNHADIPLVPEQSLDEQVQPESLVKQKVLDAHKVLMGLNSSNFDNFCNLVKMLETPPAG